MQSRKAHGSLNEANKANVMHHIFSIYITHKCNKEIFCYKDNCKRTQMKITHAKLIAIAIVQACKCESLLGKVSCRSHLIRLAMTLYLYSILKKTSRLNKLEPGGMHQSFILHIGNNNIILDTHFFSSIDNCWYFLRKRL